MGVAAAAAVLILALIKVSTPAYAGSTPSAPSNAVAAPRNGSVTISFTGSTSAGTSPILYYRVSIFRDGHDTDHSADGTTSPITVSGLTAGVAYTAKVKARNASGFGSSSKPTPAFVPAVDGSGPSDPTTTTQTTVPGALSLPSSIIDLRTWRLGLPTDSQGGTSGKSLEIKQPQLRTYSGTSFHLNADGDGVLFTAGVGGATTSGSKYPRSELRELDPSGALAAWSLAAGTHTMTMTGSVDHLPVNKPQVVAAQIHTTHASDAFELMATGSCRRAYCGSRYADIPSGRVHLVTKENGNQSSGVVDPDYALGSRYTITIQVAAGGLTTIRYKNLASGYTSRRSFQLAGTDTEYFKAGCYTQSNLSRDSSSAYGQTTINAVTVTHTA